MARHDDQILNKLTCEWLLSHLTDEERAILQLSEVEEYNFAEIGEIIGVQFRNGKALSGSAIRYHKGRILEKLRELFKQS